MRPLLLLCFCCLLAPALRGQRILLIEKQNSARTQKLFEGDYIQYRLAGDQQWYAGAIRELRPDVQLIAFDDRYVDLSNMTMLRRDRGWARPLGITLGTFGVAWSAFAAIGTATDGNPDTNYRWSDLAVTGTSLGLGLLIPTLFGARKIRLGDRHRLRIIDISF